MIRPSLFRKQLTVIINIIEQELAKYIPYIYFRLADTLYTVNALQLLFAASNPNCYYAI